MLPADAAAAARAKVAAMSREEVAARRAVLEAKAAAADSKTMAAQASSSVLKMQLAAQEAKANEKTTPSVRKNMIYRFDKDF